MCSVVGYHVCLFFSGNVCLDAGVEGSGAQAHGDLFCLFSGRGSPSLLLCLVSYPLFFCVLVGSRFAGIRWVVFSNF